MKVFFFNCIFEKWQKGRAYGSRGDHSLRFPLSPLRAEVPRRVVSQILCVYHHLTKAAESPFSFHLSSAHPHFIVPFVGDILYTER